MSTNATVPSTSSHRCSGLDRSHSIVRRGTKETSSAARSDTSGSVVAISGIVRRSGASAKGDLETLAGDQGRLLIAPDDRRDLVVELLELAVRAHWVVVEHRKLAYSGGAGEGCRGGDAGRSAAQ